MEYRDDLIEKCARIVDSYKASNTMQDDISYSRTLVDIVMSETWQRLSIENLGFICRVVSIDNYIKSECFAKPDNKHFRVIISIESISDEELQRLRK